jgi:hypothetical protein
MEGKWWWRIEIGMGIFLYPSAFHASAIINPTVESILILAIHNGSQITILLSYGSKSVSL